MASFEDPGKIESAMQSIRNALRVGGFKRHMVGAVREQAQQQQEIQPDDQIQPVMSALREALSQHVSDDMVKMTRTRTEIRVQLDDRVLFKSGETRLHPAAFALVEDVATILGDHPVALQVEGHTDAIGETSKNWELSAMRSVALVSALQKMGGMDPTKMEAHGFGQYRPADTDPTSSWNRRVELVIQSTNPVVYDALQELKRLPGDAHGL
jgi:flagellar motor protein MotB